MMTRSRNYRELMLAYITKTTLDGQVVLRNVPDWGRRCIRLSLCLILLGIVGHVPTNQYASYLKQASTWGAITCVVVTAPLIGKVAEVSTFRTAGTIVGGFFGFIVWQIGMWIHGGSSGYFAGILVVAMSPFMVVPTTYLAYKHSADQLSKFIQLTYLIVGYNAKPEKSAAMLAGLRVLGIISGGLLSLVLAVIILPRSATIESCREMKKALRALVELNHRVWSYSSTPVPVPFSQRKHRKAAVMDRLLNDMTNTNAASFIGTGPSVPHLMRLPTQSAADLALNEAMVQEEAKREGEVEKLFAGVTGALSKVEEMLSQTSQEVYVHHLYGRYFFLPSWLPTSLYGIKFKQPGKWHLPVNDMKALITIMRRIARLQWSLFCDFEEGLDEHIKKVLDACYPKSLMEELSLYFHKALLDLMEAFPGNNMINVDNLLNVGQLVDCLLQISEARNRSAVFKLRKRRERGGAALTNQGSGLPIQNSLGLARGSTQGSQDMVPLVSPGPHGFTAASHGQQRELVQQASMRSGALPVAAPRISTAGSGSTGPAQASPAVSVHVGTTGLTSFVSRALSSNPGELSVMDLPPRRLQRRQQQLQNGERTSMDAAAPSNASPAPAGVSLGAQRFKPPLDTIASEANLADAASIAALRGELAEQSPSPTVHLNRSYVSPFASANALNEMGLDEERKSGGLGTIPERYTLAPESDPSPMSSITPAALHQPATQLLEMSSLGAPAWPSATLNGRDPELHGLQASQMAPIEEQDSLQPMIALVGSDVPSTRGGSANGSFSASHPPLQPAYGSGSIQLDGYAGGNGGGSSGWHGSIAAAAGGWGAPHRSNPPSRGASFTEKDEKHPLLRAQAAGPSGGSSRSNSRSASPARPPRPGPRAEVGPSPLGGASPPRARLAGYRRNASCSGAASPVLPLASREVSPSRQMGSFEAMVEQAMRPLHALTPQRNTSGNGAAGGPSATPTFAAIATTRRSSSSGRNSTAAQALLAAARNTSSSGAVPAAHAPSNSRLDSDLVGELLSINAAPQPPAPPAAPAPPPAAPPPPAGLSSSAPDSASTETHRGPSAKESETAPLLQSSGGTPPSPLLQMLSRRMARASGAGDGPEPSFGRTSLGAARAETMLPAASGLAQLEAYLSSALIEPVTFPQSEEGYVSMVRWHSLQFILDELVEELEEAFIAASTIMAQLPYPIH